MGQGVGAGVGHGGITYVLQTQLSSFFVFVRAKRQIPRKGHNSVNKRHLLSVIIRFLKTCFCVRAKHINKETQNIVHNSVQICNL